MNTTNASMWAISDTLEGLVSLAWTTFIGFELVRIDEPEPVSPVVCSSISISGPSNATVLFFAEYDLAHLGTSAVLGMAPQEVSDPDVHDVMGEIVNIIGGNLKGIVSDSAQEWGLSLPVVSNAMQTSPGSKLVAEVYFVGVGGTVGCRILEHT